MALQQPIDYSKDIVSPFSSAISGAKAGFSIAETIREREAKRIAEERNRQVLEIGNAIRSNPNATAEDYAKFSTMLPPEQAKSVREAWDMMNKDKQQNALNVSGQVFSALNSGNKDVAVSVLKQQAEAARNTPGQEKQAQYFDTWAQISETNPEMARMNFGTTLSLFPGGDKLIESANKIGEERRKEQLQPGEVAKQAGELEKQAADLGLTKAQTNKVMVETNKLGVETSKTALELEALKKTGGIDPAKNLESEDKLRKEYNALTKEYRDVQSAYQRIQLSEDTAAGDIALIFNYMKMLDPGSVVREGEFATAQNAAGIPDRIRNAYNRAVDGKRINEDQRKDYLSQSRKLFSGAAKQEEEVRNGYARIAKNYGLNADNIFYSPEGAEKPQPAAQGARVDYQQPAQSTPAARPRTVTVDY
jgi:hypothetical protein